MEKSIGGSGESAACGGAFDMSCALKARCGACFCAGTTTVRTQAAAIRGCWSWRSASLPGKATNATAEGPRHCHSAIGDFSSCPSVPPRVCRLVLFRPKVMPSRTAGALPKGLRPRQVRNRARWSWWSAAVHGPTAAVPTDSPYCSCKLTRVRSQGAGCSGSGWRRPGPRSRSTGSSCSQGGWPTAAAAAAAAWPWPAVAWPAAAWAWA